MNCRRGTYVMLGTELEITDTSKEFELEVYGEAAQ
jgi:hypothetical protein